MIISPAMRLLDRYLLRELLVPLGYCIGGFLIFWISFNLFSGLDDFNKHHLTFGDIVEFYLVTLPEQLVVVLPVALLLALLYALTNHARHHELTAIRASGVSLWRLCLPYLAVGTFFSFLLLGINELWVPKSADKAEQILNRREAIPTNALVKEWKLNLFFQNERDNRSWSIPAYNVRTHEMTNLYNNHIIVIWKFPDGSRRDLYAAGAAYSGDIWNFYDVKQDFYESRSDTTPKRTETNSLAVPEFSEKPELISSEIKVSGLSSIKASRRAQLSVKEIQNYLHLHPQLAPAQEALLKTQFHGRLAEPWTCLTVVLIAIPFGAPSGRRNVFVGVASSIFICFVYFILMRLGQSLGTGGLIEPWLAAWLPNMVFAAIGIILTCRVR